MSRRSRRNVHKHMSHSGQDAGPAATDPANVFAIEEARARRVRKRSGAPLRSPQRAGDAVMPPCSAVSGTAPGAAVPSTSTVLTLQEAATLLRCCTVTVKRLALRGAFPCRKIGREWRFSRDALQRWLHGDR